MYKEVFLVIKPYLYQIYLYVVRYPKVVLASLGIWFVFCGVMEGIGNKARKRNLFLFLWKFVVFLVLLGSFIMFWYVTLGNREQSTMRYKLELFWSYKEIFYNKDRLMLWQVVWNIIPFFPIGNALYYLLDTKKKLIKIILISGMFSACIELTQLFGRFGLFEFDDIFDNTLGAFLGELVAEIFYRIRKLLFSSCVSRRHLLQ